MTAVLSMALKHICYFATCAMAALWLFSFISEIEVRVKARRHAKIFANIAILAGLLAFILSR